MGGIRAVDIFEFVEVPGTRSIQLDKMIPTGKTIVVDAGCRMPDASAWSGHRCRCFRSLRPNVAENVKRIKRLFGSLHYTSE